MKPFGNNKFKLNISKKYDSKLEEELHNTILSDWNKHNMTLDYVIYRTYHPDFTLVNNDKLLLCEVKGMFWDSSEPKKYISIRQSLDVNTVLFFLFADANKPLSWAKKRKNGSRMTHKDWCKKNGFIWFDLKNKPLTCIDDLLKEL